MLCSYCKGIQYDELFKPPNDWAFLGQPHHRNYDELRSCSNCDFCRMITQDTLVNPRLLRIRQRRDQQIYLRIYPSYTTLDGSEKTYLLVHCTSQQSKSDQTTLATYGLFLDRTDCEYEDAKADPHAPANSLIPGRPISAISSSDDCYRLADSWLRKCLTKHGPDSAGAVDSPARNRHVSEEGSIGRSESISSKACRGPQIFHMPSRTIEVGSADGDRLPRLICHEAGATGQWVTLSHCWDGSVPLKTTTDTISQWQEGIPFDQLPLTFQHAVEITRRLGFEHLWIDSLCIIQDSSEDWSREASQMNSIYRNGVLNIAADTARTCHDGIFTIRSEPPAPLRLPLNSQKHNVQSSMCVRSGDHNEGWDIILGSASSLSSRAWVFQESVLSPRTLRYGKRQLFWECSHCILGEISVAPLIDASKIRGLGDAYKSSLKMLLPADLSRPLVGASSPQGKTTSQLDLHNLWLLVITKYTQRELTYSSDKLAALAGIASFFALRIGERYLAGIFESDVLRSLLWRVMNPKQASAITPTLAPSWSWASITGAVELEIPFTATIVTPRLIGNLTADICGVETFLDDGTKAPSPHLIGTSRATLEIEGHLLLPTTTETKIAYDQDVLNDTIKRIRTQTPNKVLMSGNSLHFDVGKASDYNLTELHLIHLGAWEWTFGFSKRTTRLEVALVGLLLRPPDSSSKVYRRVGIATVKMHLQLNDKDNVHFVRDMEEAISRIWKKTVITIV